MSAGIDIQLPPFAVVIVSYGSSALLSQHAASIDIPDSGTIVVVDCFTTGAERERVRSLSLQHGWEAVLLERNAGFGGGTNAGAARALELGAQVLVALNPDASIDGASLVRLVAAVVVEPMLLASPTIQGATGDIWFAGADLYLHDGVSRSVRRREQLAGSARRPWATGACFAISAQLWRALDGFDDEYFLYWEDVDLSHRALDAGARLGQVDAHVVHDEGGTHDEQGPGRAKSELYDYYSIRNRMLYAVKHLDGAGIGRWRRSAPRVAYGVLLQSGRRHLVTSWRPWRALLRGLRDGERIVRSTKRRGTSGEARAGR